MKILILGAKGLLGEALQKTFADQEVVAYDRDDLDVTNFPLLKSKIIKLKSETIINCVAWNDVDGAEKELENGKGGGVDRAVLLNARVPEELARISKELGITFVTYSTDHVFDGENSAGYSENDAPNPVNAYGKSKALGEKAVQENGEKFYLIRTSRLYGAKPSSPAAKTSFVLGMIELAKKNKELKVVDEEPGAFTYVEDLAEATRKLIEEKFPYGIYHLTNSGAVTWYECARMIFQYLNASLEPSRKVAILLKTVSRSEFPRTAKMPKYSILINTKFPQLRDWNEALREFLKSQVSSFKS